MRHRLKELLAEFEENYPLMAEYGFYYIELIDEDIIIMSCGDGNDYVYDSSKKVHKLINAIRIKPDDKLSERDWRLGFSYWLNKHVKAYDITDKELSYETDIDIKQLHRFMNGTSTPTDEQIEELALALNCTTNDLLPHVFIPYYSFYD